jgi:hypothetical protein
MLLLAVALSVMFVLLFNMTFEFDERMGFGLAGTPAAPVDFNQKGQFRFSPFNSDRATYTVHAILYFALFLMTQWLFLMPRGGWRLRLDLQGRPLRRSALAAGFVAMLLTAGLLAVALELPFPRGHDAWDSDGEPSPWIRLTAQTRNQGDGYQSMGWFLGVMLIMWIVWGLAFWRYSRSLDRHTAMTRIFRGLVAGTFLETLVAGPAHAYLAREEMCYCTRGSYTALVFGFTAALWLFGPGVFLLFLREKHRIERMSSEAEPQPVSTDVAT